MYYIYYMCAQYCPRVDRHDLYTVGQRAQATLDLTQFLNLSTGNGSIVHK